LAGNASLLCEIAHVSRSGYYKWLLHSHEPDRDYDDYLLVKEIFDRGKAKWGFLTIQMNLFAQRIVMNHKKIARIMKKYHLITAIRRKNP
jgi:putative transposase